MRNFSFFTFNHIIKNNINTSPGMHYSKIFDKNYMKFFISILSSIDINFEV
jgi:hypothetical protein